MSPTGLQLRCVWLALALGLSHPLLVRAQASPLEAEAEATFFIETITLENADRVSPDIVRSESLLREGGEYTEAELRDAVHRIVRLPFILDAEFSLRKGSERGRYELVITLDETRRWFFALDSIDTYWQEPISVNGLDTTDRTEAGAGLIGRRWAAGRQGLFFLALGGEEGTLTAGFQRFGLLGRNAVASGSLSIVDCDRPRSGPDDPGDEGCRTELEALGLDPTASTWSFAGRGATLSFTLSVPVRGNHSLQLASSWREIGAGVRRRAFDPLELDRFESRKDGKLNVSWVFNTVDDPVFPAAGSRLEAGVDLRLLSADFDRGPRLRSRQLGGLFSGTWYRPLTPRQSLSYGVHSFLGASTIDDLPLEGGAVVDEELQVGEVRLTIGHSQFLLRSRRRDRVRDLRWESELAGFVNQTSPQLDQPDNPLEGFGLTTGVTYRNRWGVFRVALSFVSAGS